MALTKRHPGEARPNGRTAPKGSVKGKTPSNSGHKVAGKGRSAPKGGAVRGSSRTNMSNSAGRRGHGGRSSNGSNYGQAGGY